MKNPNRIFVFTTALQILLHKSSKQTCLTIGTILEKYLKNWRKAGPAKTLAQSAARARQLHTVADRQIFEEFKSPGVADTISCRAGCAHCCKINVGITTQEADLLIGAMLHDGKGMPLAMFEKIGRQVEHEGDTKWKNLSVDDRRCVFLGANEQCTVYAIRPLSCRKYYVKSPAEACDVSATLGSQVLLWIDVNTEILATAAMTAFGFGSMPSMLLQAFERYHQQAHENKPKGVEGHAE